MIDKFLDYISVEKRYSQNTLVSYKKDLEDLLLFISETEGTEDLKKVDKKIIRNFIVSLSEKKIQKRSINRKLSSLRSFYLYLLKIGEIQVSPLETIPSLKFYAEKQIPISEEEMENLGEILESESGNSLEKLIIETLYQTGMRKSELCNILLEQVDFSKSEIFVKGKGNKQRVVPISENLLKQMREYIAIRKPNEDSGIYFFVRENGKKLSEKFVYSVVNRYLSLITLKTRRRDGAGGEPAGFSVVARQFCRLAGKRLQRLGAAPGRRADRLFGGHVGDRRSPPAQHRRQQALSGPGLRCAPAPPCHGMRPAGRGGQAFPRSAPLQRARGRTLSPLRFLPDRHPQGLLSRRDRARGCADF